MCFYIFENQSIWKKYGIPTKMIKNEIMDIFNKCDFEITNSKQATSILSNALNQTQTYLKKRITTKNSYTIFLKLYFIFDEIMNTYLNEKKERHEILEKGIRNHAFLNLFESNRNIEKPIIDACNIWIENTILFQSGLNIESINLKKDFVLDKKLFINLYIYGAISKCLSLLNLSNQLKDEYKYTGVKINANSEELIEIIKYHPYVYFNTLVAGNQNIFVDSNELKSANTTAFGKGFIQHTNIDFLCFIAALVKCKSDLFKNDMLAFRVLKKDVLIHKIESYTNPKIDGQSFCENFILTKDRLSSQLRNGEQLLWKMSVNEFRHELRPFIELNDHNILISCAALEQSINLWHNYYMNGGKCYTNESPNDSIISGLETRNRDLSKKLVDKIIEILDKNFTKSFCRIDVDYKTIFGIKKDENGHKINYGDYDIVFFDNERMELFLIESKYFSDSFNTSSMINDYKKMFKPKGYLDHCLKRYELVLRETSMLKKYIGSNSSITLHMLFISSKPLEIELQDKSGTVTFLSLSVFEDYINKKLYDGETGEINIYSTVKI